MRWVRGRVADVISYLPKLTGTMSSDTGIGWKNPVSKTFLPKTKFRVGVCSASKSQARDLDHNKCQYTEIYLPTNIDNKS